MRESIPLETIKQWSGKYNHKELLLIEMSKNSLSLVLLFYQKTPSHIEVTHVACSFSYRAHAEFGGGLVGSIHLFKCQLSFGAISIAFHQSHQ